MVEFAQGEEQVAEGSGFWCGLDEGQQDTVEEVTGGVGGEGVAPPCPGEGRVG